MPKLVRAGCDTFVAFHQQRVNRIVAVVFEFVDFLQKPAKLAPHVLTNIETERF